MSSEQPIVSICCLVYNHEPFLRDCFEGFVMQKTTFPIEILVHDDASTDHSVDIIREYTEKYPNLFKPIYQKENQYSKGKGFVGMTLNFERAKGKYIAMCEGDDYWTDPLKLQKQVEFLEGHDEYAGCFHNVRYVDVKGNVLGFVNNNENTNNITFEYCLRSHFMATASVVFRNKQSLLSIYYYVTKDGGIIAGDRVMTAAILATGKMHYMSDVMSDYRRHSAGLSNLQSKELKERFYKSYVMLYTKLYDILYPCYKKEINTQIFRWNGLCALEYYRQKKYKRYLFYLMKSFARIENYNELKAWIKLYLFRIGNVCL